MTEYELLHFDKRPGNFKNFSKLYKTEKETIDAIDKMTCEWVGYGEYNPHYNITFIIKEYKEDYESSIGQEISKWNCDGDQL